MNLSRNKIILSLSLFLVIFSIILALLSIFPYYETDSKNENLIENHFQLNPNEIYRQGLGSFHGDENITIKIQIRGILPINFTLLTYGGPRFSNLTTNKIIYNFQAGADYYEGVFKAESSTCDVDFVVDIQKTKTVYHYSWLGTSSKVLFFGGISAILILIVKRQKHNFFSGKTKSNLNLLTSNEKKTLKILVLSSLVFWLFLLIINSFPLGTFEEWYTDNARHPYTANLFTKVGFSVFDTSLGSLSNNDNSFYKFVTWPEMPHLYPLGSIFLFFPFGQLVEAGLNQQNIFKIEILCLLVISHIGFFMFLRLFWKQELAFGIKALGAYLLYMVLVVYAANGQFDSIVFLFSLIAVLFFLDGKYDKFILFLAVSATFKYQVIIFLFPLLLFGLIQLLRNNKIKDLYKNKIILLSMGLFSINLFTAFLSVPFLINARPELVMNGVNAFSPHAQIPWILQAFAVLLTLIVTLAFSMYMLKRNKIISFSALFLLVPCFIMPYIHAWYLPSFLIYALLPKTKRDLEVTMVWLIFMLIVLSFGGISYNPIQLVNNIKRVLNI